MTSGINEAVGGGADGDGFAWSEFCFSGAGLKDPDGGDDGFLDFVGDEVSEVVDIGFTDG